MMYVIDASVAFKWVVAEPDTPRALRLRDDYRNRIHDLLAPDLFPTEIGNAVLVAERRGRVSAGQGPLLLADILRTLPTLHPSLPHLLPRAYEIAAPSQTSIYDCLYVALAEREGCAFVTGDGRLASNLSPQFPFVVELSSLP
jgi:predicted nucleic acid-binding protein